MADKIQLSHINFDYYNIPILKDITINIKQGKVYSIIGPNGSGKTTLLSIISKSLQSKSGSVLINGENLKDIKITNLAKELSIVRQSNQIEYEFKVEEIVLMGRTPFKKAFETDNETDYEIAHQAMKKTNIYHLKDKLITQISGGELQRVILARAITQEPKILLLDEPISSLDIKHQLMFMKIIKDLSLKQNITVINIVHDLNIAISYSDMAIMLKDGKIFASGNVNDVITTENIYKVYGVNTTIFKHPQNGRDIIVFD